MRDVSTSTWNGSAWASTVNEYFLWADGEIIQKRLDTTSSNTRTHYYDQGETRQTGTGTSSGVVYARDHLRSINSIADTSGNVHWSYRYDPFGARTAIYTSHSLAPTDRSYTGHWSFKPSTAGMPPPRNSI